ncbi:hypothetical protein PBY51_008928 [Eleginops maclovinus]|uniref:A-kinase anchor protein 14 n=1 Tax=Eleginops maclovinus TaxID=56733 RepID=A0AAN7WV16_ELEMC|nr:hypothetical protein PBY51_008928 [Eleginops maclovinus]
MNLTTESAQLVKTLLEKHRHPVSPPSEMKTITWVAIRDFTVEVGIRQIEEYIQTWELQPCWLHSLDFICSSEEEHYTFYHYRARFSTLTWRKPIQGTASVYFAVDIPKVKPQTLPVEVHFVLESNRLMHTPGRTTFREQWLVDVIESKTLLRRAVNL